MKTALLVIDMQKYFDDMVDRPLPQIQRLVDFFRDSNRPVIFTQHGHTPDELICPIKNQLIRKVGPEHALMVDSEDCELVPKIWKMAQDAPVIGKNTYDAFICTDLKAELQKQGIERVLITGVMSDICCNTTARSAFVRGYETWFISDACGSATLKQHRMTVFEMANVISKVCDTGDAVATLRTERH